MSRTPNDAHGKMEYSLFLILVLCSLSKSEPDIERNAFKVKLPKGEVLGYQKKSYYGRNFLAFEGIPYAKPPIGDLRFKDPIPEEKWDGILMANKSSTCSQTVKGIFSGSEDCLYINVYTPQAIVSGNFDVIVHIHGGAFQKGSALTDALPDYLLDKDVILVTMNYRLGVLGFLSTGDERLPGNLGLKDQNLALKWIKSNIKHFGGNPNSITLTGFSKGGVSVHYHLLSPMSIGLFTRAYSISGTALNDRSLEKKPLVRAQKLAKSLNCTVDNIEKMIDCLHGIPVAILTNTKIEFRPTVENNCTGFLPDHPYNLIKSAKVYDVPWVVTNVADEAFFLLDDVYKKQKALDVYNNWVVRGSKLLELNDTVDQSDLVSVLQKLKERYFGDTVIDEDDAVNKLNRVMSDRHFFVGSDLLLRSQPVVMKSPIYYGLYSFLPEDYLQCGGSPKASSHCVDDKLIFKSIKNPKVLKPREEEMMNVLTKFLAEWAKTGLPKLGDVNWIPIKPNSTTFNVLRIKSPKDIKMIEMDQLVDRKFWNSLPIKENDAI